ncbi:thiol-disulfide oxidoreductase DCC [Salinivibrio sp. ML198]|uniref:thiol-disulfide oxidoreductase DCC family protein n=1 Tax=unclassified Salinivibrio TaxID=2636825 RepID=UPI000985C7D1|nr:MULTISPECIES: DUF393 domain-containing protein [unclassified Salinivibrio]OOE66588.1 thiol-disulfide oxidoreductase DCC [Salinivibrio sp. IB868]OOE72536.1 thiol-disulfide oxidoreductase DCC [Salinivibrio sp. IB870]OOE80774.1 thiol-disulfide oxidoreductase DCC [Salinivibrio sp. ML198]
MVTVFYDSMCPLCVKEMRKLSRWDTEGVLQLVDIHQADFCDRFPHVDPSSANRILHAQDCSGKMVYGLDATYIAWQAVGKGHWVKWLRRPGIAWFADKAYLFFARHRYRISALLTGQARCQRCQLE